MTSGLLYVILTTQPSKALTGVNQSPLPLFLLSHEDMLVLWRTKQPDSILKTGPRPLQTPNLSKGLILSILASRTVRRKFLSRYFILTTQIGSHGNRCEFLAIGFLFYLLKHLCLQQSLHSHALPLSAPRVTKPPAAYSKVAFVPTLSPRAVFYPQHSTGNAL